MDTALIKSNEGRPAVEVTYNLMFWIFLVGCVLGVLIEGVFCVVGKGAWESHVVSVWGWLNLLYGAGAVLIIGGAMKLRDKTLPVKVVILALTATLLEFLCGLALKYVLGMKAWDYSNLRFNVMGLICPQFALVWGLVVLIVCLLADRIMNAATVFEKDLFRKAAMVLTVVLAIDFGITFMAIFRWSDRHYGTAGNSRIGRYLDDFFPDEWMEKRFIEWRFLSDR